MKKLMYFSLLFLLIGFISCQKEETPRNKETTELEKLRKLTSNYIDETLAVGHLTQEEVIMRAPPKWLRVVMADLKGIGTGLSFGRTLGLLFPNPYSSWITLGTGIIFGAGESTAASMKGGVPKSSTYNPNGNFNNPYDFMGLHHYKIIDTFESINSATLDDFYDIARDYLLASDLDIDPTAIISNAQLSTLSTEHEPYKSQNISFLLDNYSTGLSTESIQVIKLYSEALENSNNLEDFITYSLSAEDIIITSKIDGFDKLFILSYMSTARYGAEYWGLN